MLDLIAIMESKWFFEWRQSAVHNFMNEYSDRNKIPGKITDLDSILRP